MKFRHKDGDRASAKLKVPGVGTVEVSEDNLFEAEVDDELKETLVDLGHEIVEDAQEDGVIEVEGLGYDELREFAKDFDDIDGRGSAEEIAAALAEKEGFV